MFTHWAFSFSGPFGLFSLPFSAGFYVGTRKLITLILFCSRRALVGYTLAYLYPRGIFHGYQPFAPFAQKALC